MAISCVLNAGMILPTLWWEGGSQRSDCLSVWAKVVLSHISTSDQDDVQDDIQDDSQDDILDDVQVDTQDGIKDHDAQDDIKDDIHNDAQNDNQDEIQDHMSYVIIFYLWSMIINQVTRIWPICQRL